MLSHILFATDASEPSDHVVDCISGLRRVGSHKVVLVHVLNVRDVGGLYERLKRLALPRLEQQKQRLEAAGFEARIEVPLGYPAYEINRVAGEHHCSLVVLGSHGESLLTEALLGSTAYAILHNIRIPTLLIRFEITEANGGRRCRALCEDMFGHVLHPTDFSDTAERAFRYLEHVVRHTHGRVTLMHVQDKARIDPHLQHKLAEFNRNDQSRLERRRDTLLKHGAAEVNIEIPYGSPTGCILERARQGDVSLILMGSQGRGFLSELFLGSVAHNVARHAPLPVLLIPAPR